MHSINLKLIELLINLSSIINELTKAIHHNNTTLLELKMTQDEIAVQLEAQAAQLVAVKDQLTKVSAEVTSASDAQAAAIMALQAELQNATVSPALQAAFDKVLAAGIEVNTAAQALDALNPDAVPA